MENPTSDGLAENDISLLSESGDDSVSSILGEWSTSRALLASSSQRTIAAYSSLGSLCTRDPFSGVKQRIASDALAAIEDDISVIQSTEQALCATRARLLSVKNKLVPANKLPPEVLESIFSMAVTPCLRDTNTELYDYCSPDNLTEVCTYWRSIALGVQSFWTHIDLSESFNFHRLCQRSLIMLERSQGAPIHLHIFDPLIKNHTPNDTRVNDLLELLTPHMSRVHTLEIDAPQDDRALYVILFGCVYGSTGSVKKLSIFRSLSQVPLFCRSGRGHKEPLDEFLLNIHTLHLESFIFDLSEIKFVGLVDLRLSLSHHKSPYVFDQDDFTGFLESSPRLRILKLSNLMIAPSSNGHIPARIKLDYLEVLNLKLATSSLSMLIPLIAPPTHFNGLSVGVTLWTRGEIPEALKEFFSRSCISTLYIAQRQATPHILHIMPLLNSLPRLENLAIQNSPIGWETSSVLSDVASYPSEIEQSDHFHVHDLGLSLSELFNIGSVLSIHSRPTIHLIDCTFYDGTTPITRNDFQSLLFQTIPNVNCTVSSENPTNNWPCYTMFDD